MSLLPSPPSLPLLDHVMNHPIKENIGAVIENFIKKGSPFEMFGLIISVGGDLYHIRVKKGTFKDTGKTKKRGVK